jgi:hypothetical protein
MIYRSWFAIIWLETSYDKDDNGERLIKRNKKKLYVIRLVEKDKVETQEQAIIRQVEKCLLI